RICGLNRHQIRRILGLNWEDIAHLSIPMKLYFGTKGIKNKTEGMNLLKSDAVVDHCLSQPAIRHHRLLFEGESYEGQYLRFTMNTMLIDLAKPKKQMLADGIDDTGDCEGEGNGEGEGN
ncbi:hypothetical protein Q9L58_010519, partial [Maublancomyces gigas]